MDTRDASSSGSGSNPARPLPGLPVSGPAAITINRTAEQRRESTEPAIGDSKGGCNPLGGADRLELAVSERREGLKKLDRRATGGGRTELCSCPGLRLDVITTEMDKSSPRTHSTLGKKHWMIT